MFPSTPCPATVRMATILALRGVTCNRDGDSRKATAAQRTRWWATSKGLPAWSCVSDRARLSPSPAHTRGTAPTSSAGPHSTPYIPATQPPPVARNERVSPRATAVPERTGAHGERGCPTGDATEARARTAHTGQPTPSPPSLLKRVSPLGNDGLAAHWAPQRALQVRSEGRLSRPQADRRHELMRSPADSRIFVGPSATTGNFSSAGSRVQPELERGLCRRRR